jgi:putative ABC transport system permease protein
LEQTVQTETKPVDFKIVGVYKAPVTAQPGTESVLYIGLKDAQVLDDYSKMGTPEYRKYSYAFVKVAGGEDPAKLAQVQAEIKSLGYQATSIKDTQAFLNQIIAVLRGIVAAFGAIAVIASVFGIVNTMYISVLQRTREIGLMKALGMRKREIGRLFRFEAAWIGFLGGLLGSLTAVILGTLLNPWITEKLTLGEGQRLLIFRPEQIAALIVALIAIAIVAGLLPARKAAKLNPIEALRTE